ncbi:radical SAM protein [Paraclostridium ghonii]|uniref:radical SAM protein n=1 Tax=Paraclostridium ghonii TaxID=29358 RepID=UPI00202D04CD|nr:radical SAM protein [Paeniclostridium ghonii]MCM0165782.1 radical SAM protein [Paeniclostridium ghonii]
MIRLSIGTAIELGIKKGQSDIPPTTAYIMIGNKCNNRCSFCSQSIESNSRKDKLSRVLWPEYTKEGVLKSFKNYRGDNIKRVCLQSMASEESHKEVKEFITYIKNDLNMPISLSAKLEDMKDIEKFFDLGVDKIGIAIDAVNKDLYEKIKGNNFEEKINFIKEAGLIYPNKISTHIIVGLGESHKDIYDLYKDLKGYNINISLFAFTPVKGTKMENISQPNIESYRRVQLMTYMIDKGYNRDYFKFGIGGYLEHVEIDEYIKMDILKGKPFEIKGCENCNRPYYNERPGHIIYNYSRNLTNDEIKLSIEEINLNIGDFELCKNGE